MTLGNKATLVGEFELSCAAVMLTLFTEDEQKVIVFQILIFLI